jgi:hypothetical protein
VRGDNPSVANRHSRHWERKPAFSVDPQGACAQRGKHAVPEQAEQIIGRNRLFRGNDQVRRRAARRLPI